MTRTGLFLPVLAIPIAWSACSAPASTSNPEPAAVEPASEEVPDWIWNRDEADEGESIELRYVFTVEPGVESARLWATADNTLELSVNGVLVIEDSSWKVPSELDVREHLRDGENTLQVWARNDGGPGGFVSELVLERASGPPETHRSGPGWEVLTEEGWVPATTIAPLGQGGWDPLDEARPPTVAEATPGSEIEVPEGFRVDRLYTVPRVRQGSWVSLTASGRGRLIASDQYGDLYRITLPPISEEGPVEVERLPVELGEAQGLLCAFDSLYVVVNRGGTYESGLYRLREEADGGYGEPELLKSFDGNGEHGPHAIVPGPDGDSLYVIAGNHTKLPQVDMSHVPMLWEEDRLGPHLNDPNGHAVGITAPGGWVCRTDPEGKVWELVAIGFRNPYDIAFNEDGELFTYDSDMEWDVGLPWYRPTRVLHVAHGGEFGWRTGTDKWPATHADSMPAAVNLELGSPTGVLFGWRTFFPEPWRDALFVADWAYGTLYAVHLEDRGASYGGRYEPFLFGKALPLTDLATPGDGALYFTTGGRRTQSALYRVTASDTGGLDLASSEVSFDPKRMEKRLVLRTFEGLRRQGVLDQVPATALFAHLDSPDRYERFRYRALIEGQPVASWRNLALEEERPDASIEACIALVRADADLEASELYAKIASWPLEEMDTARRLSALRAIELSLLRMEDAAEVAAETVAPRLEALLPTGDDRTDRELVRLLAYLQVPGVAAKGTRLLRGATPEGAIEYALLLSQLQAGWSELTRADYLAWFVDTAPAIEGGHSAKKYVARIRERAHETLGVPLPEVVEEESPVVSSEPPTPRHDWTAARLLELWNASAGEERSLERGKELYTRASCATCHRFDNTGGSQGPDLTGVASRFSVKDILDALVEPSASVSDQYRDLEFWKDGGEVVVGRLEDELDGNYIVRTGLLDERVVVPVDAVTEKREHPLSRMPEDLLDPFDEDEVLDLLAFLLQ